MKISIKAESSSVWEDLNFLTEETEIEYIRVDDFLISPQTVKVLSDEFSSISTHSAINAIPGKHLNPRNHIYGLVDLVRQQTLAIHFLYVIMIELFNNIENLKNLYTHLKH